MSLKQLFSDLYSHRNDSPEEFKIRPEFEELSNKSDVISKIDSFMLPEVIKLICCSPQLMKARFAEKYKSIQPLYMTDKFEALSVIQRFGKAETLELEILKYADFKILETLDTVYINAENDKNRLILEVSTQEAAIQDAQKKKNPDAKILEMMNEQLEKSNAELNGVKGFLSNPVQKAIVKKIRTYKNSFEKGVVEKRREAAYCVLSSIDREAEIDDMVNQIIEMGVVSQIQINQLKNENYVKGLLINLSKEENKRKAIDALLKLYDIGAIDVNEAPVFEFFEENTDLLLDYLLGISPDTVSDTKSENLNILVDLALRLELKYKSEGSNAKFYTFWNTLTDEFDWTWMVEKVSEIYPDDFNDVVGILMRGLTGKASRAYVNVLFGSDTFEKKKSTVEIFSASLSHSDSCEKDSIINALRLLEKNNRSTQVKLNTSERKLRCQSQELFSSMYVPLEHLEELAINLSITTGQIDATLVGKQLRDQIADLRGALEIFDVKAVADIDDWKNLKDVAFDPEHHKLGMDVKNPPSKVMFKSLGFSYSDDEGVLKERPAQVFKKIARRGQHEGTQQIKDNQPKLKRERKSSETRVQGKKK